MHNIETALFYIETQLGKPLDLAKVARHCELSPFALARTFALATGWPVVKYIRARRLSQAALALGRARRIFCRWRWTLAITPMKLLPGPSANCLG